MLKRTRGKDSLRVSSTGKKDVRAPAVVAVVVLFHSMIIGGAFVFMQGCGTMPGQTVVEPPPAPVMPPPQVPSSVASRTTLRPPVPVEPAPPMAMPTSGETYVIKKGESLSTIAKRHGISYKELAEINGIKDPNKIRAGQKLVLPPHAKAGASSSKPSSSASRSSSSSAPISGDTYVVQSGDSLSKIAKRTGTSVSSLKSANSLSGDLIRIGQKLSIPKGGSAEAAAPAAAPSTPAPGREVSAPAEPSAPVVSSLDPILSLQAEDTDTPVSAASTVTSAEKPLEYTVLTGDTLEDIAKLFIVSKDEVVRLNNLSGDAGIKPGMKLLIPPPDL